MSHPVYPLLEYKHEQLMNELNEMCKVIKVHLFDIEQLKNKYPKPTIEEIDKLQNRINAVLREDAKSMRRY